MLIIAVEALTIVLLVLVGGALAMSEMAVVTARKSVLLQRAEQGDRRAHLALRLAEAPGRFLSTVQIGITLVGVLAGALGGATIAGELAERLARLPIVEPYADVLGVGLVVAAVTFLSLLFGELVPKRMALSNPERVAASVAPAMFGLAKVALPLVVVLNACSSWVLRALRIRSGPETPVTDDEIQILLHQGASEGVFEPIETEIVGGLFRLSDQRLGALVTPRTEIVWLDPSDAPAALLERVRSSEHGRYPVARDSLDHVLGIVSKHTLFEQWLDGGRIDLEAALKPALFVPESTPALDMLERFREHQAKIALVIDEFGGVVGLVTINDVLAGLIGELPEGTGVDRAIVRREDGSWLMDGMVPLAELEHRIGQNGLRAQFEGRYHTVGGWVMAALGRIPVAGEVFEVAGATVEVVDMDGRRVDKVLVYGPDAATPPATSRPMPSAGNPP